MKQNNNDEIDLGLLYGSLKQSLKRGVFLGFKALDFIIKKKLIIVVLIAVGVALGFYSETRNKEKQQADVLLRVNFDSVNYVYSSVEELNNQIENGNISFLKNYGFNPIPPKIKELEIMPIVNLKDIVERYAESDRNLETLVRNLEFDEDELVLLETFNADYKYHNLKISFTADAQKEDLDNIISYINNNDLLQEVRKTTIRDLEAHVISNKKSVSQIDAVMDAYHTNESLSSPSDQIYIVDKNFSVNQLLEKKIELLQEIEGLNKYLAYSKDIAVVINKPRLFVPKKGFIGKKTTLYPTLFVFMFLFLAYLRYIFYSLKEIARKQETK